MVEAHVTGVGQVPNGTYDVSNADLALTVIREALTEAGRSVGDVDGLYMPKPRPWDDQQFATTFLGHRLGVDLDRSVAVYTGGSSGGTALRAAASDVRAGTVETALVVAVERSSTRSTETYFEHALSMFDREFQAPAGPTIPGLYAQSYQRYCHEHDVDREDIASIVVKNHRHASENPNAYFSEPLSVEAVLDSPPIAEPLCRFECPAPVDGAAALVVTNRNAVQGTESPVGVVGIDACQTDSHFAGPRSGSLATFPAVAPAVEGALVDAGITRADLDVLEPYAPFPHVEAIITEELGYFDRGDGAAACRRGETSVDGRVPVSPSGGCLGRGHPPMVSPLLNHAAAVAQCRGTAPNQVNDVSHVLTTSEHGHVDGVTATVFTATEGDS